MYIFCDNSPVSHTIFADLFDAAAYMFVLLLFFADRYTNFGTYVDFIYIFYSQKYPVDTSFKL